MIIQKSFIFKTVFNGSINFFLFFLSHKKNQFWGEVNLTEYDFIVFDYLNYLYVVKINGNQHENRQWCIGHFAL